MDADAAEDGSVMVLVLVWVMRGVRDDKRVKRVWVRSGYSELENPAVMVRMLSSVLKKPDRKKGTSVRTPELEQGSAFRSPRLPKSASSWNNVCGNAIDAVLPLGRIVW